VLFEGAYRLSSHSATSYDVSSEGRFLRIQPLKPDVPLSRIEVILNWAPVLK
jgi:hypothetical protein